MDEAVRTTASPAAIWVIVIVMSICTVILVSAAAMADSWQARANRRARRFGVMLPGFVRPGTELSGDLAGQDLIEPEEALAAAGTAETVPAPRSPRAGGPAAPPDEGPAGRHRREAGEAADDAAALAGAEAPTRPDLPPVPGRHAMPAQRDADFDRAAGSRREGSRPDGRHPDGNRPEGD
jgi:hypothetical protein